MRRLILIASLVSLTAATACQTMATDDPDNPAYSRSSANRAKTDDPIKALQKY